MEEKYISARYLKTNKKVVSSFQVVIHYTEISQGKSIPKTYKKSFRVSDYVSEAAARKAAIAHRNEMLPKLKNGPVERVKGSATVSQLAELIPAYYPYTKSTAIKNGKVFRKYIEPEYGETKISEISRADVTKTLRACAERCVEQHVRNVLSVWRKIFQIAIDRGEVTKDATHFVTVPKSDKVTIKSVSERNISVQQFDTFCKALATYGDYKPNQTALIYDRQTILYMVKLCRLCGFRSQEVRAIRKDYIEFLSAEEAGGKERALIYIFSSIGSNSTEMNVVKRTKTPQSQRIVPIEGKKNIDLLREIYAHARDEYLFARYDGTFFTTNQLSDYLNRVSKSCGVKVTMTLLRKSLSSDFYSAQVAAPTVKGIMGHVSENMSANWYASPVSAEILDAMEHREDYYKKTNVPMVNSSTETISTDDLLALRRAEMTDPSHVSSHKMKKPHN